MAPATAPLLVKESLSRFPRGSDDGNHVPDRRFHYQFLVIERFGVSCIWNGYSMRLFTRGKMTHTSMDSDGDV